MFTAALDLTSVSASGDAASQAALATNLVPFTILSAGKNLGFDAQLDSTNLGSFSVTYTLNLSDDSRDTGAADQAITLTVSGVVNPFAPGDFNLDHHVDAADVSTMMAALVDLNAFESSHQLTDSELLEIGDVNGDGKISNADLSALLTELDSGQGSVVLCLSRIHSH